MSSQADRHVQGKDYKCEDNCMSITDPIYSAYSRVCKKQVKKGNPDIAFPNNTLYLFLVDSKVFPARKGDLMFCKLTRLCP